MVKRWTVVTACCECKHQFPVQMPYGTENCCRATQQDGPDTGIPSYDLCVIHNDGHCGDFTAKEGVAMVQRGVLQYLWRGITLKW